MNTWWYGLQIRERLVVGGGAIATLLLLVYVLAIDPFLQAHSRLATDIATQQETLDWMRQAGAQVQALRGGSGGRQGEAEISGSLLSLVDSEAKRRKLGDALKRVQPDGSEAVRVWFEDAAFDTVLIWLDELYSRHGVEVAEMVVDAENKPGKAKLRLSLKAGGA